MSKVATLDHVAKAICNHRGYKYITFIDKGAFKETFHVKLGNNEEYALKVYLPDRRSEREEAEISALRRCNHANIAKLIALDNFSTDSKNYLYIVEEFIGGGRLSNKIEQSLLHRSEIIALGEHLIDAVAHIASHDLVHRDLKPDNILFRHDGVTPVIVDFGIVRDLNATSKTGTWQMRGPGTPFFAAPEQLNNEKSMQNWRTDQFSLGVLLAISIFGKHPYDVNGMDYMTVEAVASRQAPSKVFKDNVRTSGLTVLEKMVAPFPVRRYRTTEELAQAWSAQK